MSWWMKGGRTASGSARASRTPARRQPLRALLRPLITDFPITHFRYRCSHLSSHPSCRSHQTCLARSLHRCHFRCRPLQANWASSSLIAANNDVHKRSGDEEKMKQSKRASASIMAAYLLVESLSLMLSSSSVLHQMKGYGGAVCTAIAVKYRRVRAFSYTLTPFIIIILPFSSSSSYRLRSYWL